MPEIVVLVSGNGSNLQALIDAIALGELKCAIKAVIADRACFALERAKRHNIPFFMVDRKIARENLSDQISKLIAKDCDLIVLAGFLSILNDEFTASWENKVINIHPSLLPKYGGRGMWGRKVHAAVIANQETESGCTIHFVSNEIDGGAIIHQEKLSVSATDDVESLQSRIHQLEYRALATAIRKLI